MRISLFILVVWLASPSIGAEPFDLTGGALIAHYVPEIAFCLGTPCEEYSANHAIHSAEEQINRIDALGVIPACWFVLAAWTEEKIWCGAEFGLGDFNPSLFHFDAWYVCYPSGGGLEIPSSGWPGPQEGIAMVVAGPPWQGDYVPLLAFTGYAYGNYGTGIIPLASDPMTGFVGFANCDYPPQAYNVEGARLGGMGINIDGIWVEPLPYAPPVGACCIFYDCSMMTQAECLALGGQYMGDGTYCWRNPCLPVGACCLPEPLGACVVLLEEACTLISGEWLGPETTCHPVNPCAGEWVCCVMCDCYIFGTQMECEAMGGVFHPEWDSCEPNPCIGPHSPANETSWGAIKGMYR